MIARFDSLKGPIRGVFYTAFRFRYVLGVALFAVAVAFSIHFSSISVWDIHVPGDETQRDITIFGQGRPIRSDEWSSRSILMLAQAHSPDFYPLINPDIGSGMNMFLSNTPVWDLSAIGRPQFWGFFMLGPERGFSWFWCSRLFLLFFTSLEWMLYITKGRRGYALFGAILIAFAPLSQWWASEIFIDLIIFFQLFLVCLIAYFKVHTSTAKRVLCLVGMVIALCGYAFSLFPAVMLPLFLILLVFTGYILFQNKASLKKMDVWMAGSCILVVAVVVGATYLKSWSYVWDAANIAQAQRFLLPGAFDIKHQLYEYISLKLPFADYPFLNNCEISRFITMMPLTLLLFPVVFFMQPQKKVFIGIIYSLLLAVMIWAFIPFPEMLGKAFSYGSLLYATTRVHILMGLLGVYLLAGLLPMVEEMKLSWQQKILLGVFAAASLLYAFYAQEVKEYLLPHVWKYAIVFLLLSLLLVWQRPRMFAAALGAMVLMTGLIVNPISRGLDPIYNKPISRQIEALQQESPESKWLIVTNLHHTFLPALGVKCYNTVQFTPFFDQWRVLDPEGKYKSIYSRYAFVKTVLTREDTYFESPHGDLIVLNLNIRDLPLTGTRYIYSDQELEQYDPGNEMFEQIYRDPTSGYLIYRIHSPQ